ncbi:hypothetical protein K440DRAFT_623131, partial [Wilcoxina mikolae CBS 423.85]
MATARVLPPTTGGGLSRYRSAAGFTRAYEGVRAWILSSSLHVRVCSPGGLQIKRGM